jgi:hypothetical protein
VNERLETVLSLCSEHRFLSCPIDPFRRDRYSL